jgi:hypothetical protein
MNLPPILLPVLLLLSVPLVGFAQGASYILRPDYRNELFDPAFTNGFPSSLTQAGSVAFFSGNIGDGINSASTLRTNTPNDGQYYLTQSIIGQPVGILTVPYNLGTNGIGSVTTSPNPYAATNWYQLGQIITNIAQPGRWRMFSEWSDHSTANPYTVMAGASNFYSATFIVSNTVTLETNIGNGVARIARFGTPLILLNGNYYSNNVVPAANGTVFQMTVTNSFPGGTNYFSLNGSIYLPYTVPTNVTAPFSISAIGYSAGQTASESSDPIYSVSATSPGGGSVIVGSQADLFTGAPTAILTASPSNGWTFLNWVGAGSAASPIISVPLSGPTNIQAIFGTALATSAGSGGGSVGRDPDQTLYSYGTTVRLSAVPAAGFYFNQWGGALNGTNDSPVDFVITNANQTNVANFLPLGGQVGLALLKIGSGTLAHTPPGWHFDAGTPVTLNATSAVDQTFIGWTGDTNSTSNPLTLKLNSSMVITGNFAVTKPTFALSASAYSANESDTNLQVTVVNSGALDGWVTLATANGTAIGGLGNPYDYTPISTNLYFINGIRSTNVLIPIRDHFYIDSVDKTFQLLLSNPLPGSNSATLGSPATAQVTIHYNDAVTTNGSALTQVFPGPAPATNRALQVILESAETNGQWHFVWEIGWHNSGETVTNLPADDLLGYDLEFRDVPNLVPVPGRLLGVPVAGNNGAPTIKTNQYYPTTSGASGSLRINIQGPLPTGAGWRLQGEPAPHQSGDVVSGLLPGTYRVQFETVNGKKAPASSTVELSGQSPLTPPDFPAYSDVASPTNAPVPLAGFAQINSGLGAFPRLPYAFNGQLWSPLNGFGSGVAVRPTVVLTAAHVVFDYENLTFNAPVYWFFQKQAGEFDARPLPMRGCYPLAGYTAARTTDKYTNSLPADRSSYEAWDQDVAALYFSSSVARGGFGGYLCSDPSHDWLTSNYQKMLVGYPVDSSAEGYTNLAPGKMHATPQSNYTFSVHNDQVYVSSNFVGFAGNSGGPLYVLHTNDIYYPAAVYLGSDSNRRSVVRAIDTNVVYWIYQAATYGDDGENHAGGGVSVFRPGQGINNTNKAYLQILLGPAAAVAAGANWSLQGNAYAPSYQTNYTVVVTTTNDIVVQFKDISAAGWDSPASQTNHLSPGVNHFVYAYTRSPRLAVSPTNALAFTGYVGGPFSPAQTLTLTNSGESALDWAAIKNAPWLSVSPASGAIPAQSSRTVTLSILAGAAALGNYSDTLTFTNQAGLGLGTTNRLVSLHVDVHPQIIFTNALLLADGSLRLTLLGLTNQSYSLLVSTNLLTPAGNWTPLSPPLQTDPNGQTTFAIPAPLTNSQLYFRAREL